jgi:hypothetical protein
VKGNIIARENIGIDIKKRIDRKEFSIERTNALKIIDV